jgi:hypothetical protein
MIVEKEAEETMKNLYKKGKIGIGRTSEEVLLQKA